MKGKYNISMNRPGRLCLYLLMSFLMLQCSGKSDKEATYILPVRGEWFFRGDAVSLTSLAKNPLDRLGKFKYSVVQKNRVIYDREFFHEESISFPIPEEAENGILEIRYSSTLRPDDGGSSLVYYLEEPYGEPDLTYYPPLPMVNTIVEAQCQGCNVGDNTYLRWTLEGRVIGEGYLSDGWERVSFYCPHKGGNYTLGLELFPRKPLTEGEESLFVYYREVFIDEVLDRDSTLDPDEWETLFICDGTHIDRGTAEFSNRGQPSLSYQSSSPLEPYTLGDDRGYRFNSESRLFYDGKLLCGRVTPLSVFSMRIILDPPSEEDPSGDTSQILHSRDGRGTISYSLFRQDKDLLFSLGIGDEFIRSRLALNDDMEGRPFWLSIVLDQRGDHLLIRWYLDGILSNEDRYESLSLPSQLSGGGSTLWGKGYSGYPSFEGVLLEWGFTANPYLIKRMEEKGT